MILRLLQKHGHRPVVLVGGGTTRVGDPTGKDASRNMLDDATIAKNIAGISDVFETFLEFGEGKAVLVNNADWLDELKYVEFLRDIGSKFSVNRMLSFESVKQRLGREQPFSFLEFNYMLLQAYDRRAGLPKTGRGGARRGDSAEMSRGAAAAATRRFRGDGSRRQLDYSVETSVEVRVARREGAGEADPAPSEYPRGTRGDTPPRNIRAAPAAGPRHDLRGLSTPPAAYPRGTPAAGPRPPPYCLRYDFLELHRRENCVLQLGGSDQWGNIVSGVELARRVDSAGLVGLTAPLLQTADGRKMGKTADGAVWLGKEKLAPYDYWQFWRNCADDDVGRFLKLFTESSVDEVDALEAEIAAAGGGKAVNAAKRRLADECSRCGAGYHPGRRERRRRALARDASEPRRVRGLCGAIRPLGISTWHPAAVPRSGPSE